MRRASPTLLSWRRGDTSRFAEDTRLSPMVGPQMPPFDPSWKRFLGDAYVEDWRQRADGLYTPAGQPCVYPDRRNVFRAFEECPLDCLKVVIVGEDPYGNGHADGLALSVPSGKPVPRSLWIVFSEICHELQITVQHENGNLARWAQQGVLLLNSRLTIGQKTPIQWESFTGCVLRKISEKKTGVVFMLWGSKARALEPCIVGSGRHFVLRTSHPSPQGAWHESGPFVGCQHFRRANKWLIGQGRPAVNWA